MRPERRRQCPPTGHLRTTRGSRLWPGERGRGDSLPKRGGGGAARSGSSAARRQVECWTALELHWAAQRQAHVVADGAVSDLLAAGAAHWLRLPGVRVLQGGPRPRATRRAPHCFIFVLSPCPLFPGSWLGGWLTAPVHTPPCCSRIIPLSLAGGGYSCLQESGAQGRRKDERVAHLLGCVQVRQGGLPSLTCRECTASGNTACALACSVYGR